MGISNWLKKKKQENDDARTYYNLAYEDEMKKARKDALIAQARADARARAKTQAKRMSGGSILGGIGGNIQSGMRSYSNYAGKLPMVREIYGIGEKPRMRPKRKKKKRR